MNSSSGSGLPPQGIIAVCRSCALTAPASILFPLLKVGGISGLKGPKVREFPVYMHVRISTNKGTKHFADVWSHVLIGLNGDRRQRRIFHFQCAAREYESFFGQKIAFTFRFHIFPNNWGKNNSGGNIICFELEQKPNQDIPRPGRAATLTFYTYPIFKSKVASWSKIFLLDHIVKI